MEQIFDGSRNVVQIGSIEYVKDYGVIARKQNGQVRTFLTSAFGQNIQTVKKMARDWVKA